MSLFNKKHKDHKAVYKWFWLWQDDKYEEWLGSMSRGGWHLSKVQYYPGIKFHFKKGEPKNYVYRLDYKQTSDKDMKEYVEIFNKAGWEYVGNDITWKYFRKEIGENETDDIYSDNYSKIQKYEGMKKLVKLVTVLELICMADVGISTVYYIKSSYSMSWMLMVFDILILTFIPVLFYGMHKLRKRIKELKNSIV